MKKVFFLAFMLLSIKASAQLATHNWSTQSGGTNSDIAYSIVTDHTGSTYTTGYFQGTFTVGFNTLTSAGGRDIFLIKRNSSGAVVFAKSFGGTGNDYGRNVEVDNFGSVYLVGDFEGTADMDPNAGVTNLVSNGNSDAFVARLTPSGLLLWAQSLGGSGQDLGLDVDVHNQGFAIEVVGAFSNTVDWNPGPAIANMTSAGSFDGFIWNLNNSGNVLSAWRFGSTGSDMAYSIAIDNNDQLIIGGKFAGTVDFNNNSAVLNLTSNGNDDIFIGKWQGNSTPVWVHRLGGSGVDRGRSVAVDSNNNVVLSGMFQNTVDFDPSPSVGASSLSLSPTGNPFVVKFNSSGNYMWHKYAPCSGTSESYGVAMAPNGTTVVVGGFSGTMNIPGQSSVISQNMDAFFWTLSANGNSTGIYSTGGSGTIAEIAFAADMPTNNDIYFAGTVANQVDLNLLTGTNMPTAYGFADAFSMKYQYSSCTQTIGPITTAASCNSYSSPISSTVWTSSGTFYDTLTNAGGCDSILQYDLTITQPTTSTINPVACDSWVSPNNTTYTSSGTYTNVINNTAGCDSTITINLTISASPTPTIAFNGTDLSVANTYTSYEWKRNGMVISGAATSTYTPTQNGNYEVTVSNSDNCTGADTYNLMNVSVANYSIRVLSIYPNPSYAKIEIGMEASSIQIRNLQGALLLEATDTKTMDVENLANGIYMIYATHKGQQYFGKFVKQ